MRRHLHRLGTALLLAGALALAWSLVVWRWQDPATALYTRYEQHRLSQQLESLVVPAQPGAPTLRSVATAARRFRLHAEPGHAIGRLVVPRIGLSVVVVEGVDSGSLRLGPGRDPRSLMPGEGGLVYVAGHRTTFLAPFSHIDALRPGDRIRFTTPYAVLTYVVTGHSVVAADDLRVLRPRAHELLALQACHPRFFASHRYLVWSRLRQVVTPAGVAVRG